MLHIYICIYIYIYDISRLRVNLLSMRLNEDVVYTSKHVAMLYETDIVNIVHLLDKYNKTL